MKERYITENFFKVRLAQQHLAIATFGDPLEEFVIYLETVPTNSEGWIIIDFNDSSKRDLIYYHSKTATSITYYRKNRSNPTVLHKRNSYCQMNDVAEFFNYLFDNVDDLGLVKDMGTNKVQILGGQCYYDKSFKTIADSAITTLADGTWYAVLDYSDDTLKCVSSVDTDTHLKFATIVVASTDISSITDNRTTQLQSNKNILDGLTDVGGNLLYNGVPIGGGAGNGDVVGPSSSVAENIVTFLNTTGKVIKDSLKKFSIDGLFTGNSDNNIPTEKAIKTYVDTQIIDNRSVLTNSDFMTGEALIEGDSIFPEEAIGQNTYNDGSLDTFTFSGSSQNYFAGYRIEAKHNGFIKSITKAAGVGCTRAVIKSDTGNTILATATFSGDKATFSSPYAITKGTFYRVEADNSGSSYMAGKDSSPAFPILNMIAYNTGSYNGDNNSSGFNIASVETTSVIAQLSEQNVGDVAGNTRVSIRQVGSGVAGNTLKLSLAKVVNPSVDFNIRLETDNAGAPSGTLIDANATASVAPGDLTTDLADTTITLAGSITIPKGDVAHVVLFQGTYGSETVNGSNYYKIGYAVKKTTTRGLNLWNTTRGTIDTGKRIYTSSDLFTDTLYSKTDARYTYRLPDIPRIVDKAYSAGEIPKRDFKGITKHLTGLTKGDELFVSETPGALSNTAGANRYKIGDVLDTDELLFQSDNECVGGIDTDVLFFDSYPRSTKSTTYVKFKEILINSNFKFRIKFDLIASNSSTATARIYKNGVAYGTEQTNSSNIIETKTEDLYFEKGDLLQVYVKTNNATYQAIIANLRLYGGKIYKYIPATIRLF